MPLSVALQNIARSDDGVEERARMWQLEQRNAVTVLVTGSHDNPVIHCHCLGLVSV